jgi:6-phosphogluconolactonase
LIVAAARAAIDTRGWFALVLAGGSTPRGTYQRLSAAPLATQLPWQHTHVFFGDERCVPHDHPDSNSHMADTALLAHVPIPADHVHRISGAGSAEDAARAYEDELRSVFAPGRVQFDLVLLGIGPDGHTASLFPGAAACAEREKLVAATPAPKLKPRVPRITMTFPALNSARETLFLVAGPKKKDVLDRVLAGDETLPAALVRPCERLVLYWTDQ